VNKRLKSDDSGGKTQPSFLFILADDWRNSGAIFSHTQRIDCLFLATHLTRR